MTKGTYNYDNLLSYCCDNNVTLLQDYKDINVTRDTLIVGKCNNKIKMLHFITQIQITDTRAFNPSLATPKIYQVQ
jgi:hypothetical protein